MAVYLTMRHSSRQHFLHAVLPAYREFVEYHGNREIGLRGDTRRAAALAGALRDLPEHVFEEINDPNHKEGYKNSKEYREAFWAQWPFYQLVCNFADAWKHRDLSRSVRLISSVDDISECHIIIRHRDELGYYYSTHKLLAARISNGQQADVASALVLSTELWIGELVARSLLSTVPKLPGLSSRRVSRIDASKQCPVTVVSYARELFEIQQLTFVDENDNLRPAGPTDHFEYAGALVFEVQKSPLSN